MYQDREDNEPARKVWGRYHQHKRRAARSDIPFEISFEDWVAWWEQHLGPDWLAKRGSRCDQYVMARYGDKGPYKLGNIKCITCSQNSREGMKGNTNSFGHKLTAKQRAKRSAALKGNQNQLGHKHTAAARAKISATLRYGRRPPPFSLPSDMR